MSTDPVIRLMALNSEDADEAIQVLFPCGIPVLDNGTDAIEDAIVALTELVEEAITRGANEVLLDLTVAELLTIELKRRKRKRGHPRASARADVLRTATLRYAEDLANSLRNEGHGIEKARSLAAIEASERAIKAGDQIGPSTIVRKMKEAAAARKKRARPPTRRV